MTYRFEIEHRTDGSCVHRCNGQQHLDARGLARLLVESGAPDGTVEAGPEGKRYWTFPSLHAFAAGRLTEGEKGFRLGIYAPYMDRTMHPALERAVSRATVARKNRVDGGGR